MCSNSTWGKDVKKALIDREMTIKQLAIETGHCVAVISSLINGRYAKSNYAEIANQINGILGTDGLPERPKVPSDDLRSQMWAKIKTENINIKQLSERIGYSRDRISLVLNGHYYDEAVVKAIKKELGIDESVPIAN